MLPPRKTLIWNEYFMNIVQAVSLKSKDPNTQVSAILVDEKNRIISTGYNGGSRKIDDNMIDWSRETKMPFIIHAEENCLWMANRRDLEGCKLYVGGKPCSRCMLRISHSGINKIYYGNKEIKSVDEKEWQLSQKIAELSNIELIHVDI